MAVILFMGAVSGAHLNPVASIAFALRRDFPWKRVPGHMPAQLAGATLASLLLLAVFGNASTSARPFQAAATTRGRRFCSRLR